MPKIKITLTADISDLESFWPDDPIGVTRQNIWMHLNNALHSEQLFKLTFEKFKLLENEIKDKQVVEALIKHYEDNVELAKRMLHSEDGFQFEVIE